MIICIVCGNLNLSLILIFNFLSNTSQVGIRVPIQYLHDKINNTDYKTNEVMTIVFC